MSPSDWTRLKSLFAEALECPVEARAEFVDERCPPGSPLRADLEGLLRHHAAAGTFLEEPLRELGARLVSKGRVGLPERIGPFRIIREIGRGGMGTVYEGERDEGGFEQRVAIKIIRRGMDTDEVHRRFLLERQVLARLDHPHIARLLDGGVTADGRPYFVMEYIEGVPLAEHLSRSARDLEERLRLFRSVCHAVHYAHQNLVLHRDLKPSNILITPEGQPKLLDFGVAKLLDTDEVLEADQAGEVDQAVQPDQAPGADVAPDHHTRADSRYLTPGFASPEQLRGAPLTTASDVYGLGLLLFGLLTADRPFPERTSGVGVDLQATLDREAPRPSAVAAEKGAEAPIAASRLRGDLDVIVTSALRADPERRYESAERLSADVERYLDGLPIVARADSVGYRLGKFVRRHRWGVGASVVAGVGVVAALAVFAAQSVRIAGERDKAQRVTALLVDLLQGSDPAEALGDTLTARAMLDRSEARIETELSGQPEVQAALFDVVGGLYHSLGLPEQAEPPLRRAVAIRREVLGAEHVDVAQSLNALAGVLDSRGHFDEAQEGFEEALRIRRDRFRSPHPAIAESLNDLGQLLLFARQDFAGAEPLLVEALDMRRRLFTPPHRDVAESVHNVALLDQLRGRYAEAADLYRESLEMRRSLFGETHPALVATLNNLALVLQAQGHYREAEPLLRESLGLRERLLGPSNPQVSLAMANLALTLRARGDADEAERLLRASLDLATTGFGESHPRTATIASNLADVLRDRGSWAEAEPLYRRSLEVRRAVLGPDHPHVAFSLNGLAEVARGRGDLERAEALHGEALELRRTRLGEGHPDVAQSLVGLALTERAAGTLALAEDHLREGLRVRESSLGTSHPSTAEAELELADLLLTAGRADEAARLARSAALTLEALLGTDDPRVGRARAILEGLANR